MSQLSGDATIPGDGQVRPDFEEPHFPAVIDGLARPFRKQPLTSLPTNYVSAPMFSPHTRLGSQTRREQLDGLRDDCERRLASRCMRGLGDTHLLVPTAAGVREPQNRRVEIIIR